MQRLSVLEDREVHADTLGMALTHLQFDTLDRQNLHVMQAYALRDAAARASADEHDGWLDRFDEVEGLDRQSLTQVHGQLIADRKSNV